MTPNSIDMLLQKIDSIQADLSAVVKSATEFEAKSAQLKKQVEGIKTESSKARELLVKLAKVR
jgi:septal ring factor EnvC (AmiA/AmiB activator)